MATTLPILLPDNVVPRPQTMSRLEWTPKKYRSAPQPPPTDDGKIQDIDARQMLDGKLVKKTRPRRTVDYNGGMGRWTLVRRSCRKHFNHKHHWSTCADAKTTPEFIICTMSKA
jgi:polyadenylation factor subunit 2